MLANAARAHPSGLPTYRRTPEIPWEPPNTEASSAGKLLNAAAESSIRRYESTKRTQAEGMPVAL